MKSLKYITLVLFVSTIITSCKKKDPEPEETPTPTPTTSLGSLVIKFENKVGSEALVLNSKTYTNNSDSFTVSTFNYYVSNIKLTATDNSIYNETESYHLVKSGDSGSMQFTLSGVPQQSYASISFIIGVDSLRNVSGAQTGALDPVNGHFWSWNSGYIMAKFEGNSPQSTATENKVMFHVGGFSGPNSVLKTVTLPLTTLAAVSSSVIPQISLKADLGEWFSPNAISFVALNTVHMPGADAKKVADNYANMFSVSQVSN